MAVDVSAQELWLVRNEDGLELDLRPLQGLWTEEQYLKLTDQTNRLIEFSDGVIEVLPMPTSHHQRIVAYLYRMLFAVVQPLGGIVLFAPLRLQTGPGRFREPDLVLLLDEQDSRYQNTFWLGADLAIEVVSPDKPKRDLEDKRVEYAEAGIAEYWIVHPLDRTISVLTLSGEDYTSHGVFHPGEKITSVLLTGFDLDAGAVLEGS
jgi:Uma2 family endonuclease